VHRRGEGKSGGGEGRTGRRVATNAPLLGADREQVEPDLSLREEEDVRVGRKTGAAQEVERRRVRLPGAAIFVRPVTTTPPTQREPTRSLAFPCTIPFPWFHVYERVVEPLGTGSSSSPHGWPPNRAALVPTSHAATPCRRAGHART
jgi:hypothetical protein